MISTSNSDSSVVIPSPPIQNVSVTVDAKGRVRVSKEQRRAILAEFERSGVSGAQFAMRAGLKYSTLAGWLQRYRRGKSKPPSQPMRLLEAVVEPAGATGHGAGVVVLRWEGGAQVEVSDARQIPMVAALIRALAKPC